MEKEFHLAAYRGQGKYLKGLLEDHPTLDVNWKNLLDGGSTALQSVCVNNHDHIVPILLAHLAINVNLKNNSGQTAFFWLAPMIRPPVFVRC